ncbi:hypothetical protein SK128_023438, partial [Halocaridina rubra]
TQEQFTRRMGEMEEGCVHGRKGCSHKKLKRGEQGSIHMESRKECITVRGLKSEFTWKVGEMEEGCVHREGGSGGTRSLMKAK